jgi:hypothetical protein
MQIKAGTRLGAMILDHFVMTMLMMVFFIPGMISSFSHAFKTTHEQTSFDPFGGNWIFFSLLGFVVYFCKDNINGRSFAKRALEFQVVNNATGQVASPLRCFIRNIFCIIWPIEVLVAMISPSRRLGDRVAGTKLVCFDPSIDQPKITAAKMIVPLTIAYASILVFVIPFKMMLSSFGGPPIKYMETSYNDESSKELEKLLSDSLERYLVPDVRIYDKIEDQDVKYVSTILHLKENFLEDEERSSRLDSSVERLIYSKLPKETFTGNIKYVFETSGQMQSSSHRIGTNIKSKPSQ